MLPVVNKPLIEYAVQEAVDAGLTRIGFVTGRGKRAIEDHFDKNYELEDQIRGTGKEDLIQPTRDLIDACEFSYTRQKEMKGLGHAILTGETLIGDEPFAVVLADDLCIADGDGVLMQMVKLFRQFRCSIVAVEEVPDDHIHQYGVVAGEPLKDGVYRITDMIEKPSKDEAPSNLGIIGRYILTPDIFDLLRETPPGKNGELQITDALKRQAQEGCVLAYRFKGRRFDCGSIDGFVDATNHCYDKFYKNGF
jgi:UTP--glucose-1-phosphate uridylyltransferase